MVCFLPQQTQALLGPLSWTQNNHHLCWSQHAPPWYFTLRYTHLYRQGTCGPCKKRTQEAGPQYLPRSVGWIYGITWGLVGGWDHIQLKICNCKCQNMNVYVPYVYTIHTYTITLAIFTCGFHAVLTQSLPRQVHWQGTFNEYDYWICPQKRWSFHWMTPHKKPTLSTYFYLQK